MIPRHFISEASVRFCLLIVLGLASFAAVYCEATVDVEPSLPRIAANTNQHAAGALSEGGLSVELEIREGAFFPEAESGPSLPVFAFAERGKQLQVPGPMIRIPQETSIHVTIHNMIAREVLIHGLHPRPGKNDDTFAVPAGATRDLTFSAGAPGAYYYWATAGGDTLAGRPYKEDSQLHGAFIVDPTGTVAPDRVFVIGMWRDRQLAQESFDVPVINGKSWPYTERLEYPVGSDVRWVWLNPSGNVHPMHMHGSYFRVLSAGDAEQSNPVPPSQLRDVSTNFLAVGGTMTTLWKPERTGRWIFHCHILTHISPETSAFHHETMHDAMQPIGPMNHMSGLVMGITILAAGEKVPAETPAQPQRKLQLVIAKDKSNPKKYTYSITEPGQTNANGWRSRTDAGTYPQSAGSNSPDQPSRRSHIRPLARNRTGELLRWCARMGRRWPASHTHDRARANHSTVLFAPPRAGTFMYHTHMNDLLQLSSGLYGALIVLPEGENFHPETDKVLVLSRNGKRKDGELLLNGSTAPVPLALRAGSHYRLRFIDILANNSIVINAVQDGKPIDWIPLAKDGADLAPVQSVATPASFTIAPGETYDFALTPAKSGEIEFKYELILLDEHISQVAKVAAEVR